MARGRRRRSHRGGLTARRDRRGARHERAELIASVERLSGRVVEAFLGDNLYEPDVAVEIFLLAPADGDTDAAVLLAT